MQELEVYRCSREWLGILLLSSGILLVTGILGSILSWRTVGPDILGYVSPLMRDNPYVKLPSGGPVLSGGERSRLLENLWLRLEDQRAREEGHAALSSFERERAELTGDVARVRKGRLYD